MAQELKERLDVSWRRGNLLAAVVLLAACGAGVCVQLSRPAIAAPDAIPVDRARVDMARHLIDPNVESAASLRRLPRIGAVLAQEIVDRRSACTHPAFVRLEDLDSVRLIGPATIARLAPYLSLPPGAPEIEPLNDE